MLAIETGVPSTRRPARENTSAEPAADVPAEALTVNEFMRVYKLGRSSTYKLIRSKQLQSKKVLGKRLIVASSARALLACDESRVPLAA